MPGLDVRSEEIGRRLGMMVSLGPVGAMVALETEKGRRVVRPGDVDWLPIDIWHPDTVCSVGGREANLILLLARRPGTGALGGLLAAVEAAGLVPLVHVPQQRLARHLRRLGWDAVRRGAGGDVEVFMRPPAAG